MTPKETNPGPSNLKHRARSDCSRLWLTSPEMVEMMYQSSVAEPIASSPGPILARFSNLRRWNLLLHSKDGLILASA